MNRIVLGGFELVFNTLEVRQNRSVKNCITLSEQSKLGGFGRTGETLTMAGISGKVLKNKSNYYPSV